MQLGIGAVIGLKMPELDSINLPSPADPAPWLTELGVRVLSQVRSYQPLFYKCTYTNQNIFW